MGNLSAKTDVKRHTNKKKKNTDVNMKKNHPSNEKQISPPDRRDEPLDDTVTSESNINEIIQELRFHSDKNDGNSLSTQRQVKNDNKQKNIVEANEILDIMSVIENTKPNKFPMNSSRIVSYYDNVNVEAYEDIKNTEELKLNSTGCLKKSLDSDKI